MKRFSIALFLAILYLVVGNAIAVGGMHNPSNGFLNSSLIEILFAPYTFIGGLSAFAGWDWLSFVLEGVIFAITIPAFYSLLIVINHIRNTWKERRVQ